jgi:hypothetical protein
MKYLLTLHAFSKQHLNIISFGLNIFDPPLFLKASLVIKLSIEIVSFRFSLSK